MSDASDTSGMNASVARRARDAAYVAVGLGILGLQRARAARHDLSGTFQAIEELLPEPARELATRARTTVETVGSLLRQMLSRSL